MTLTRKAAPLLGLATLAALGLAAAPAAHAQTFTFTDTGYNSPDFTNDVGTYHFQQFGTVGTTSYGPQMLTLTPGVAQTFTIDETTSVTYDIHTTNSSTQTVFTGTASSASTLGGVTETISQMFTLDTQGQQNPVPPSFAAGAPVLFAVAPGELVTITPLASTPSNLSNSRQASALLTLSTPAAVPEPSTVAPFALAGLGLLGLTLRAHRRNRGGGA